MAQPHLQYPPRTFSPAQAAGSPQSPYPNGLPTTKQPPNGKSPYGSPGMGNISLPNQVFSSPYYGSQTNGAHTGHNYSSNHNFGSTSNYNSNPTYNSLNTPQPPSQPARSPPPSTMTAAPPTSMGPPGRPDNRPTDLNEIGDVLYGAGIDLKEEEANLTRQQEKKDAGMSFIDQLSEASGLNTNAKYPFPRDNIYSRNLPGDRSSFYGAGSFNQETHQEQSEEERELAERKHEARIRAEIKQYHLNNPFLYGGSLERRLDKTRNEYHLSSLVKEEQVWRNQHLNPVPQEIMIKGPDENLVKKTVQSEPILVLNATTLSNLLSLLSLATEERLRNIVEDAATIARGRRTGSHGLVPQDMEDLAAKKPNGETVAMLPTPSTSAVSPPTNPLKRSYSEMNTPLTPISNPPSTPTPNPIAAALQKISQAERNQEEARLAKRRKRAELATTTPSRANSLSLGTPESGTPGDLTPAEMQIPKKSALKAAKKPPSEAQSFAASNKTLNMAIGLGGNKKLSWMNKDTGPTNPFAVNRQQGGKAGGKEEGGGKGGIKEEGAGGKERGVVAGAKNRVFGTFREDGGEGRGVQLRDLIAVLELDGKGGKVLQSAYARLGRR